jgi:ubiquinone/menaquinone biosynthesis C-methylase UbiE
MAFFTPTDPRRKSRSGLMPQIHVTFDAANDYERVMGQWSRLIGERFLDWLAPPPGLRWLDIGCGTGAFSAIILKRCAPKAVAGIDPAPAQIEHARKETPQAEFRVADATALPFGDGDFDAVTSALVVNFIPDRPTAFREMHRVVRAGGVVSAYQWDRREDENHSPFAPIENGLRAIGAEVLQPPIVPEATPDGARAALERAGFADIDIATIEARRSFRDFDDYWDTQTLPISPAGKSIAALSDSKRAELRDVMRRMLPAETDGSVSYASRALAFKARKAV